MKVLVTGSSGFLGSRFTIQARNEGIFVCQGTRSEISTSENFFHVNAIDGKTDWSGAFNGVDCVVHCAAHVHLSVHI